MKIEVNPIDVEALKEFLGECGPIEYEPNYRLVLDGNQSTVPDASKVQKVLKSSTGHWITSHINLSDYEAISIALSWIEGEIMGMDAVWELVTKQGEFLTEVEVIIVFYGSRKPIRIKKETKLTALIEAHKELTK